MKHDDPLFPSDPQIEPQLEARIVAWILGEASAFESAELNRLCETRPEVGIFKRRLQAVSGLVGAAVRPDQTPLQLAPERRAKILQAIGPIQSAETPPPDTTSAVILKFAEARRKRRTRWIWTSGIAASLTCAAILGLNSRSSNHHPELQMMELPTASREQEEAHREPDLKQAFDSKRRVAESPAALMTVVARSGRSGTPEIQDDSPSPANTELKDIASSTSVIPSRLLSDIRTAAIAKGISESADARIAGTARYYAAPEPSTFDFYNNLYDGNSVEAFSRRKIDADPSTQEPLVLSPFTVEAPLDFGYTASATLAGTRIRTDLAGLSPVPPAVQWGIAGGKNASPSRNETFAGVPSDDFLNGSISSDFKVDEKSERVTYGENRSYGAVLPVPLALRRDPRTGARVGSPSAAPTGTFLDGPKQSSAIAEVVNSPIAEAHQVEATVADQPVSTFSLHVSDVSFRLAQAALARGEMPDPSRIRPEEFYNAFDYGDPAPSATEKIASRIEQSAHPFLQQRNLVRVAMKVGSTGRDASQPLHLTVLLDTSGSMEREDRVGSVHRALTVLASLLGPNDRVTLIGFARQPRLLVEALAGDQAAQLAALASRTPFTGGTNLEEALKLSGDLALRHHRADAQNRIVLITDGAANLGNADPVQLATMIEKFRQQGIAFDACGVGTAGLDDTILEALTRKGDGRYYVLDDAEDADAGFARQLAGAFRPAAENVKVQIRFNPARVGRYRLIGFEQHRLREEDFRNDAVDAAELSAEEAAVALYQVEALPDGDGELGEVFVRFRDPSSGSMVERSWTMLHDPHVRAFDRASPTLRLAGTAALLAEKMRGGENASAVDLEALTPIVNALRGEFAQQPRVQELVTMFEQMRRRTPR